MEENGGIKPIVETTISEHPKRKHSVWHDLIGLLGILFASAIVAGIIGATVIAVDPSAKDFGTFISYVCQMLIPIIFLIFLFRQRREPVKIGLSFKWINPPLIIFGVILMFMCSVVVEPLTNLMPKEFLDILNNLIGNGGVWMMLVTVLAAPILEEVLFRGVIQGAAIKRYGVVRGIVIAAAVFGVIHIIPQQVIYAFAGGLILGYIYYKTNSILSVIIIHAINNSIAYVEITMFDMKDKTLRDLFANDTAYWVVYLGCVVVLVATIILLGRRLSAKQDNKEAM